MIWLILIGILLIPFCILSYALCRISSTADVHFGYKKESLYSYEARSKAPMTQKKEDET